jgi:hypothetical protein
MGDSVQFLTYPHTFDFSTSVAWIENGTRRMMFLPPNAPIEIAVPAGARVQDLIVQGTTFTVPQVHQAV